MRAKVSMRAAIGTLIVATSIIQLANGFFGTFFSLRVALEGFEATTAGLVLSSYFAGFTLGAVRSDRIIARIGHIRAYAAFAGLVGAATALMPLMIDPYLWMALRAVVGSAVPGCSSRPRAGSTPRRRPPCAAGSSPSTWSAPSWPWRRGSC